MIEHQKVVSQANSFKTLVQKTRQPHHTKFAGATLCGTTKASCNSYNLQNPPNISSTKQFHCELQSAPRKSQRNCVNQDCKHKPEATITMRSAPMSSILHALIWWWWWCGEAVMWWCVMWWCGDVWCMWWFYDGGDGGGGDVVLDFLHCHIFRTTEEFRRLIFLS